MITRFEKYFISAMQQGLFCVEMEETRSFVSNISRLVFKFSNLYWFFEKFSSISEKFNIVSFAKNGLLSNCTPISDIFFLPLQPSWFEPQQLIVANIRCDFKNFGVFFVNVWRNLVTNFHVG